MIRTLGLATVTAALLLPLAPASAETNVYRDASRDVTRVTYDLGSGELLETRRDPSQAKADIVRIRTRHGQHGVQITIKLRQVPRRLEKNTWSGGYARIATPDRTYAAHFHRRGTSGLAVELRRGRGGHDCGDLRGRVLLRQRAFRVTIPAACLDDPRWVRTGASVGYQPESALPDSWSDDARVDGWHGEGTRLGPRVRRG